VILDGSAVGDHRGFLPDAVHGRRSRTGRVKGDDALMLFLVALLIVTCFGGWFVYFTWREQRDRES